MLVCWFDVRLAKALFGRLILFAGLYESWNPGPEQSQRTFTIITTEPNAVTSQVHNRMPVILEPASYATWLDAKPESPAALAALLRPYAADAMEAVRVSSFVNGAAAEGPRCLEPERQASLFD